MKFEEVKLSKIVQSFTRAAHEFREKGR